MRPAVNELAGVRASRPPDSTTAGPDSLTVLATGNEGPPPILSPGGFRTCRPTERPRIDREGVNRSYVRHPDAQSLSQPFPGWQTQRTERRPSGPNPAQRFYS